MTNFKINNILELNFQNKKDTIQCNTHINKIKNLNLFLRTVNYKLKINGIFRGKFVPNDNFRINLKKKYIYPIYIFLYAFDYIINRLFPRILFFRTLYFFFTKGKLIRISKAEMFGRLYYNGFIFHEETIHDNDIHFTFIKKRECSNNTDLNYGPIIKLDRIGKNGKIFKVYKLRTMHSYSEFIQEYIYDQNNLSDKGKIKNDFRISKEGKIFRKLWIDEIPMVINVLRGEMKIVGVRPLSPHYFSLYSENLKKMRIKHKPGLIPPFYYDMPKSFNQILESEKKYLISYEKNPLKTDIKYFFGVFKNIIIKGARSG